MLDRWQAQHGRWPEANPGSHRSSHANAAPTASQTDSQPAKAVPILTYDYTHLQAGISRQRRFACADTEAVGGTSRQRTFATAEATALLMQSLQAGSVRIWSWSARTGSPSTLPCSLKWLQSELCRIRGARPTIGVPSRWVGATTYLIWGHSTASITVLSVRGDGHETCRVWRD